MGKIDAILVSGWRARRLLFSAGHHTHGPAPFRHDSLFDLSSSRYRVKMNRPHYLEALERVELLSVLAEFDPRIAGTPPLRLDLADSDIDVLCHAADPMQFTQAIGTAFGKYPGFGAWQWISGERPVVAEFRAEGWTFELFGSSQPVQEQVAWRHFCIEQRLLSLGGNRLRTLVMDQRRAGLKTEPAFAAVLNLSGNPYQALLNLVTWSDEALISLVEEVSEKDSLTSD
jgi:hypothetical protein